MLTIAERAEQVEPNLVGALDVDAQSPAVKPATHRPRTSPASPANQPHIARKPATHRPRISRTLAADRLHTSHAPAANQEPVERAQVRVLQAAPGLWAGWLEVGGRIEIIALWEVVKMLFFREEG